MCEFISWKEMPHTWKPEVERRLFYLTKADLDSKKGRELKNYLGSRFHEDKMGHGAIDWFYELGGKGINLECTDFSAPVNFPAEIVRTIKNGEFEGIGIAKGILKRTALADYEAKRATLDADYEAKRASLCADYQAKRATLDADYEAKRATLDADYEAKRAPLDADYEAKRNALFWQIAKDPKNRRKEWR